MCTQQTKKKPSLQRLELLELIRIIHECRPALKDELPGPQAHQDERNGKTDDQDTREYGYGQLIGLQIHLLHGYILHCGGGAGDGEEEQVMGRRSR